MDEPGQRGQPTKFTEEVKEKIIHAVSKGAPNVLACDYAGINISTMRNWRLLAKEGNEDYVQFFIRLKEARGNSTVHWLEKIDEASAKGQWQAAAWKLERRHYKHFGRSADVMELAKQMDRIEKEIKKANRNNSSDDKEITE